MNEMQDNILEKILVPFFEPLIKDIDNFDYKYYTSFENKIKIEFENKFDDINFSKSRELLLDFFKSTDFKELFKLIENENNKKYYEIIKTDKRAILIFQLLEKVDKILPNASFLVLTRINPIEHIRKTFEPLDLIEEIEKYKGEHRARLIVRLFREVSELLYDNYIRILWELTSIIQHKEIINSTGNFGVLINGLNERLKKENASDLIEKDAGWIRNSASHAKYLYNAERDSLFMWDRNKPKQEIPANKLLSKAISMYNISSRIILEIYLHNTNRIILDNELINIIISEKEKLLNLDEITIKKIESHFSQQFKKLGDIEIKRE